MSDGAIERNGLEAATITAAHERRLFLVAASYCTVNLAFHYYGLIEGVSSVLHIPSIWFFFIAEVSFAFVGAVVLRTLSRVRLATTLGRALPASALFIVTILFVAFNTLFLLGGLLINFSGGS
jgi:hypothetical protein